MKLVVVSEAISGTFRSVEGEKPREAYLLSEAFVHEQQLRVNERPL